VQRGHDLFSFFRYVVLLVHKIDRQIVHETAEDAASERTYGRHSLKWMVLRSPGITSMVLACRTREGSPLSRNSTAYVPAGTEKAALFARGSWLK
jgi:hypothetical protein